MRDARADRTDRPPRWQPVRIRSSDRRKRGRATCGGSGRVRSRRAATPDGWGRSGGSRSPLRRQTRSTSSCAGFAAGVRDHRVRNRPPPAPAAVPSVMAAVEDVGRDQRERWGSASNRITPRPAVSVIVSSVRRSAAAVSSSRSRRRRAKCCERRWRSSAVLDGCGAGWTAVCTAGGGRVWWACGAFTCWWRIAAARSGRGVGVHGRRTGFVPAHRHFLGLRSRGSKGARASARWSTARARGQDCSGRM